MSRFDKLRQLQESGRERASAVNLGKLVGDAAVRASDIAAAAESVAQRSGLTNKKGEVSKLKIAKAAVRPRATTRRVLDAAAEEVRARRSEPKSDETP